MANTLDLLTDEQRAKVSAVSKALVQVNAALEEAAVAGVQIEISVVDVTPFGHPAIASKVLYT